MLKLATQPFREGLGKPLIPSVSETEECKCPRLQLGHVHETQPMHAQGWESVLHVQILIFS